jgi:membrane protein
MLRDELTGRIGPGSRVFRVIKRTSVGVWNDGFIHAGNLAYMALFSLFPFFILSAAIFSAIGEEADRAATIEAIVTALPPMVGNVIEPVARDVIDARSGWLLWVGGVVGLWTASSLIETIRVILPRAYGTEATLAFWRYRLLSFAMVVASVIIMFVSLIAQVLIGTAQQVISTSLPWLDGIMAELSLSRIVPAIGLFVSMFLLFITLTPAAYRGRRYPKWPGSVVVTLWWLAVTIALPPILREFFTYDLTYGSLAGIMVTLFFFWLVGLGIVIGAELNAALAEPSPAAKAQAADDIEEQEEDAR